jgi:hypothetical protein
MPKKTLPGQGSGQETQMQRKIKVVKQHATQNSGKQREMKEKNHPIPQKGDLPQWSHQFCYKENLYGKG